MPLSPDKAAAWLAVRRRLRAVASEVACRGALCETALRALASEVVATLSAADRAQLQLDWRAPLEALSPEAVLGRLSAFAPSRPPPAPPPQPKEEDEALAVPASMSLAKIRNAAKHRWLTL